MIWIHTLFPNINPRLKCIPDDLKGDLHLRHLKIVLTVLKHNISILKQIVEDYEKWH